MGKLLIPVKDSSKKVNELLANLRDDQISWVIKNDPLLLKLAK